MGRKQGERDCVIDEVCVETEERVDLFSARYEFKEKQEHQSYNKTYNQVTFCWLKLTLVSSRNKQTAEHRGRGPSREYYFISSYERHVAVY